MTSSQNTALNHAQSTLIAIFLPLKQLNLQLPKQLCDYVLTGNAQFNWQPKNQEDASTCAILLGKPGSVRSWNWNPPIVLENPSPTEIQNSIQARQSLYAKWTNCYSLEQLLRFGKALNMMWQGGNLTLSLPQLPQWLVYLFFDGLYTTIPSDDSIFAEYRQHWSMSDLAALLELDGHNPALWLHAIFEPELNLNNHIPTYLLQGYSPEILDQLPPPHLPPLLHLKDIHHYIHQNIDAFNEMPYPNMPLADQKEQLIYLHKHDCLAEHAVMFIVKQSTSSNKIVAQSAQCLLDKLMPEQYSGAIRQWVLQTTGKTQERAVDLAAHYGLNNVLVDALSILENTPIQINLQMALSRLNYQEAAHNSHSAIFIPAFTPTIAKRLPEQAKQIIQQNHQDMLKAAKLDAQRKSSDSDGNEWDNNAWDQYAQLQNVSTAQLEQIIAYLNGDTQNPLDISGTLINAIVFFQNRLQQLPEYCFVHYLRAKHLQSLTVKQVVFGEYAHTLKQCDLRQIAYDLEQAQFDSDAKCELASIFLERLDSHAWFNDYRTEWLWPFFAENMVYLDETFGLTPTIYRTPFRVLPAMQILFLFPSIPTQYIPTLLSLALSDKPSLRQEAQQVLSKVPKIHQQVEEALLSSNNSIRLTAIHWLGQLGQTSSAPALAAAFTMEKKEAIQVAILDALQILGEDIGRYLNPNLLLTQAQEALKKQCPAQIKWLDKTKIPLLTWHNGGVVHNDIVYGWMVNAAQEKDMRTNSIWPHYVRLLSLDSQKNLGEFVLVSFIAEDLRAIKTHCSINNNTKPNKKPDTPEHSALSSKGILHLICAMSGSVAVSLIQDYIHQAPSRHLQIDAMFAAIALSDDEAIIDFLLSISHCYHKKPSQDKVRAFIMDIAKRNHWQPEDLAEKTVLTANLNQHSQLHLDYGKRIFTANLHSQSWQLVLQDDTGKVLVSLPRVRQDEDSEMASNAKLQFNRSKKEIQQTVHEQSARLFDAMCCEYSWPIPRWQQNLLHHPIVRLMAAQLVWLNIDQQGNILQSFRPCDDGSLINLNDEEITLKPDSQVKLAHHILIGQKMATQWQNHFIDYKTTPLFQQFNQPLAMPDTINIDCKIQERAGWQIVKKVADTVLNQRDYQRNHPMIRFDAEHIYCKHMPLSNLFVWIQVEPNYATTCEDIMDIGTLSFYRQPDHIQIIRLADVPPILRAEAYADYLALADASTGFKPSFTL